MCNRCEYIKPIRVVHCDVCGQCTIRFDHHNYWLNQCISLHNLRYYVQLCFHTVLGNIFLLFCFYELSYYPDLFVQILGGPGAWFTVHFFMCILNINQVVLYFWLIYKDLTIEDILDLYVGDKRKKVYTYQRRSFKANLVLIFGTENVLKALFYPLLDVLPINGLEYEYEKLQLRTSNMREYNDLWSFNQLQQ
ncbi:dhhc zinc finger domain containing protein [Stylonychia lemnae]|uniref:Palmitoyltransferase n=1 Tax=Stylonychia lemnae TaxID=5949 RepID=A0A078ADX6_STYLE|nr:dhhc zinc finger domain containing protein [Stylonychia lemnae]|eukprot:CDW79737.1 dhhc zinc finger domain containing protein [Stylonychia lemnae]